MNLGKKGVVEKATGIH